MRTTTRHEFKYIISYKDYFHLKSVLDQLLIHDKHGEDDSYPVTSVYLDDIVFSGASDKAFGNEVHRKFRIRHYHDENKRKLELKEKIGDLSTKFSTPISDELYYALIDQDMDIIEEYIGDQLVRKYMLSMLRFNLEPKLVIGYQREAYKDNTDNLRITFDHSLETELFDIEKINPTHKLINDGNIILEIKYEHYLPDHIKKILKKIKLNQIAYSKYFMGFDNLYN